MEHNNNNEIPITYLNRDLSWLEFNRRVLEEAIDKSTPLVERLKFLAIVSSNLDEFMSVRVAGIVDQIRAGFKKPDMTGYLPDQLLVKLSERCYKMVKQQYKTYKELVKLLSKENVHIVRFKDLNATQEKQLAKYFQQVIYPVLTPMAVDQGRPFPLVHTLGTYLSVLLRKHNHTEEDIPHFAIVQIPSVLNRMVEVPSRKNSKKREFILLDELIKKFIPTLFSGYKVQEVHGFRVTRNADLTLNEEGAEDLLQEIEKELKQRRWGAPVRLEVEKGMDKYSLSVLTEEFEIEHEIFSIEGPLDLTFLMKFALNCPLGDDLKYPRLQPVYPVEFAETDDMFEVLREKDVLVYHPYESFDAVDDFLEQATNDPEVLAIKMTLYRVSGSSRIVANLAKAAEMGKQVTVLVELKARFDEEKNIAWARKLEQAGCHVVYGLVGLKTHAKIILIVRREEQGLRRYVHVGTGNYNGNTAKLYTDVGLFTASPAFGEDASAFFNEITGFSAPHQWQVLCAAPEHLLPKFIELIRIEAEMARQGKPARIIAKMNSFSNQDVIDEIYRASQAGVKIDLIIRGVCALRPGVQGLSENIRVVSIVDRFLEHSRIFYFANGGDEQVFIASADWMTRNLTRRIELLSPVRDQHTKQTLIRILTMSMNDNVKARLLLSSGKYEKVKTEKPPIRSQFTATQIDGWKY
jgi:polyphosphate kinase